MVAATTDIDSARRMALDMGSDSTRTLFRSPGRPMAKCCCTEQNAGIARTDLWILPLAGDRKPRPFLATPFAETLARFSPSGRWVAYVSSESGRSEVYVVSFPAGAGKRQVSVERRDEAGVA